MSHRATLTASYWQRDSVNAPSGSTNRTRAAVHLRILMRTTHLDIVKFSICLISSRAVRHEALFARRARLFGGKL